MLEMAFSGPIRWTDKENPLLALAMKAFIDSGSYEIVSLEENGPRSRLPKLRREQKSRPSVRPRLMPDRYTKMRVAFPSMRSEKIQRRGLVLPSTFGCTRGGGGSSLSCLVPLLRNREGLLLSV
jgi:hypothetical protein